MAKEVTFGVPVAPSTFIPDTGCTIESEPGLFYPAVMMGVRDLNVFPLYGERKNTGAITGPLFPTNGTPILVASIGTDASQTGTANGTVKNGTLAAASKGATTLTYTVTTTTAAPVANDYLQVGPAKGTFGSMSAPAPSGAAFVVKITSVSGSGPYTLTVPALPSAVAASTVAQACKAPFFHNVKQANTLASLTVEKNIGGYESLQFAGTRVSKYALKCQATNTEASFTANVMAKSVVPLTHSGNTISATTLATTALTQGTPYTAITTTAAITAKSGTWLTLNNMTGGVQYVCLSSTVTSSTSVPVVGFTANATYPVTTTTVTNASPSAISVVNELPFIFAEATLTVFGKTTTQVSNVQMTIDNGLKPTYTMNQSHTLQFLSPVIRHITGQFDLVFTSLDNATWGYWNKLNNGVSGALTYTFQHPLSPQYGISFHLTQINLAKYTDAIKLQTVVMTNLSFEAAYDLSNTPPSTIRVVIADGQNTAY